MSLSLSSKKFGKTPSGDEVTLFTLGLSKKVSLSIMDYGATWTHLFIPDRNGKMEDVLLGFDSMKGYTDPEYLDNYCYLGSTVGRIAGRIGGNQFELDGKIYRLPLNAGTSHLHGGIQGWDRKMWSVEPFETDDSVGITFYYKSPDGEENYPGTIDIWVTYTLDATGLVEIKYKAISDQKTIINPTNHAYFNLSGKFDQSIEDHVFWVNADSFLPMDENSIPTGALFPVDGSAFDFRTPTRLSKNLGLHDPQLEVAGGIDHCFVLNQSEDCAILYHEGSGRELILSTTEPGLQVYTSNYMNASFTGKHGIRPGKRAAICLETQHFPDSINKPDFPSVILMPGEIFDSRTQFRFRAE